MHILLATPIFPPEIGGPATYTKELCAHLAKIHQVTVVAYTDVGRAFPGTTLIAVSKQQPVFLRLWNYAIALWKASRTVDVIYVQNAMAAGFPAVLVGMIRRVPVVLKFVGDEAWERAMQHHQTEKRLEEFLEHPVGNVKIRLMMVIQGFVLRHATIVTTPSQYLREVLLQAYRVRSERIVVNYNAAEEPETLPFSSVPEPHQIVVTARLVVWKGIDGVLRAVALLKEKIPDIRLVIAGDGPEEKHLRDLTVTLGLTAAVTFLGNVSRTEIVQLLKASSVSVLNSTYEGLPHTVLESFAAGIPVVATNIPGTREVVIDKKTGLLVEAGNSNVSQLVDAIMHLLTHPEVGRQLAENGVRLLREKFLWEAHLKGLRQIFESVTAHSGSSSQYREA